jgi:hypothetical protein
MKPPLLDSFTFDILDILFAHPSIFTFRKAVTEEYDPLWRGLAAFAKSVDSLLVTVRWWV